MQNAHAFRARVPGRPRVDRLERPWQSQRPAVHAREEPAITSRLPDLTLVLGGARSGKSAFAESLVLRSGLRPLYLATAQALDEEMRRRVEHHRRGRGDAWTLVEEPLELSDALRAESRPDRAVLVDCLTLWLTNLLLAERDPVLESDRLLAVLTAPPGPVVLVSNEVGQGIVPTNALARRFVDEAGRLHQRLAAAAQSVVLVTAGLPQHLKRP